jgi:hypothetical protein
MNLKMPHKRFKLYDDLGYFRSYYTRRRAIQAIKSLGRGVGNGNWIIIDSYDNSKSIIGLPQQIMEKKMKTTKTEGGQGGKRGHSRMDHWDHTERIKNTLKKVRRRQGKKEIDEFLKTHN